MELKHERMNHTSMSFSPRTPYTGMCVVTTKANGSRADWILDKERVAFLLASSLGFKCFLHSFHIFTGIPRLLYFHDLLAKFMSRNSKSLPIYFHSSHIKVVVKAESKLTTEQNVPSF